tara:strand:- start:1549 stop:1776 length:228 start_codon:yes stop_codon:yes gene_type:complete
MRDIKFAEAVDRLCERLIETVRSELKVHNKTTQDHMNDIVDLLTDVQISSHKAEREIAKTLGWDYSRRIKIDRSE